MRDRMGTLNETMIVRTNIGLFVCFRGELLLLEGIQREQ